MDRCVDLDVLSQALDLLRSHGSSPSLSQLIVLLEGLGGLSYPVDPSSAEQRDVITPTRARTIDESLGTHQERAPGRHVNGGDDSPFSSISSTLPSPWVGEPVEHDDIDQQSGLDGHENNQEHPTTPNRYSTHSSSTGEEPTTFFFKAPQKPAFGTTYFAHKDEKPEIIFGIQNINLSEGPSGAPASTSSGAFHPGAADAGAASRTGRSGAHGGGKQKHSPLKGKKRAVFATPRRSHGINLSEQGAERSDTGVPMEESPLSAPNFGIGARFCNSPSSATAGFFDKPHLFSSSSDFIDSSGGENVIRNIAPMNLGSSSADPATPSSFAFGATGATFPVSSSAFTTAPASADTQPPFGIFAFGNTAAANQNQAPSKSLDESVNDVATAFSGFSFSTAAATAENPTPAVTFSLGMGDKDKPSSKKPSLASGRRKQVPRGRPAASNQVPSGSSDKDTKHDNKDETEFIASAVNGSVRTERYSSSTTDHVENDKRMIEFAELMKNHGATAYNDNDYESALDAFSKALSAAPPSWQNRLVVYGHKIAALSMLNRNVDAIETSNEAMSFYKSQLGTPFFQSLSHDVLASISISIMKINVRKGRALLKIGQFVSSHLSFTDVLDSARASTTYAQSVGEFVKLSPQFNQQMEQLRTDEDGARADAKAGIKQVLLAKVIYNRLSLLQAQPDDHQFLTTAEELLKICPDFRSAQCLKAKALSRQKEWAKAKVFIEGCVCSRSVSTQRMWAHPSCTTPLASAAALTWRHEIQKDRSNDARGSFNVNIADVANAVLAMGGALAKAYLACLKNEKLARFLCAESMDAVLGILKLVSSKIGDETSCSPAGLGAFCVDAPVDESHTQWGWLRDELRRLKSMIEVKNIADDKFRSSNFAEALTGYSSFIKMDPEAFTWNAVMYGNRAAALMRLELYSEAVADCTQAIDRDPLYYRAHLRRARAYKSLGEFASSMRDYRSYLSAPSDDPSVSPSDREAIKAEVDEVSKLVARAAAQQKQQQQQQQQQQRQHAYGGGGSGSSNAHRGWNPPGRRVPPNPFQTGTAESDSEEEGEDDDVYFTSSGYKGRSARQAPPQRPQSSHYNRQEHTFRSNYQSSSGSGRDPRRSETGYSSSSSGPHAGAQQRSPPHVGHSSRSYGGQQKSQPRSDVPPPNSHYATLGISMRATDQEIKTAFRQLALKYHPDKNKQDGAEDKFKLVTEAYTVLMDKTQRRTYDFSLHF